MSPMLKRPKGVVEQPKCNLASNERNRWNASLQLFLTGGVGERLCRQLDFGLNLPPLLPRGGIRRDNQYFSDWRAGEDRRDLNKTFFGRADNTATATDKKVCAR
jgi:hypothetical protein